MHPAGGKHCPSLAAVGRRERRECCSWKLEFSLGVLCCPVRPTGELWIKRGIGKGAGSVVTDVLPFLPAPRSCLRAGNSKQPRIRAKQRIPLLCHRESLSASKLFVVSIPIVFSMFLEFIPHVPSFSLAPGPRFLGSDISHLPFLLLWEDRNVTKAWYELPLLLSSPVLPQPGLPTSSHFSLLPEIVSKCQKQILT